MKTAKVIFKLKDNSLYKDLYNEYLEYDNNIKMSNAGIYELTCDGSSMYMCCYTVEILDTLKEKGSLDKVEDIVLYLDNIPQENILNEYNKL